ncbi:STE/STE11/CDC15 protein kinase [Tremella mesenterica]|uniref:STE/STE11/CDC15 protein kinase n=1 Tax=Tremella mesenterica TaxID=5217 RepID=A0A4Q1BUI2_TREME|nr:STE/STE11/CDC15 protein kinase [Tremella mesenterica]
MAAAVALSNYQLGDLLGRGASGNVYRALNFLTGETVAIKSISLLSLPPSSLPDIMSEIDLLKNLNHPNIVKYKGFARDKENLFIVLEYCENGSLQSILKKFGKFPESLVAVYISQVLEGLIYLHEQGVVHRDIKGANILTNKDGSVKLADFGVSSRAQGPGLGANDNEVVGSPYWMAPEVIEQSGATTASDIWSVGCVVVELLEGKPPHGELAPMQALWRIVQDESMKVPEGASPIVKDFLYHCFQKDSNLRVTAKKLLRHPWMMSARRAEPSSPPTLPPPPPASYPTVDMETLKAKKPSTKYDDAVIRVQEWNEALNASPKALGTMRRVPGPTKGAPRKNSLVQPLGRLDGKQSVAALFALGLPSRSSADSLAAQPSTSAANSPAHPQPGLISKNFHVNDVLTRAKESGGETWDDDFASDISLTKLNHKREESTASEDANQKTLKASPSPTSLPRFGPRSKSPLLFPPRAVSSPTKLVDDYSDLVLDETEQALSQKLANLKLKHKARKGLMHPDDLRRLKTLSPMPAAPKRSLSTPSRPVSMTPVEGEEKKDRISPSSGLLGSPKGSPKLPNWTPPGSRSNSLRTKVDPESQAELLKYSEEGEEDYSDIFDSQMGTRTKTGTQSLQLTKRSNRSWLAEGDEETDPFAEFDDDFDAEDLEANLLRDKRATLCAQVNKIVDVLVPQTPPTELKDACDELLALLENTPAELGLETHFVSTHGMLALLEVLEGRLTRDVAVRVLKIVNTVVSDEVETLESFCLVGGIPVIIPYTSKKHSLETRLEACMFIQQLTRSPLTLQMFISCRGLRILVELLDEDYSLNRTLILSSLEGIGSVFELQSPTPRNDFCRMFVREGILDPLSSALLSILNDENLAEETPDAAAGSGGESGARAIAVLLMFCQVAQADGRVRDAFANRTVLIRLLKACAILPRTLLVVAVKAIKHLSTSPQLIEVLQNSNAMEVLVNILGKNMKGLHSNEICSHIFQTIFSMCRLSKARQEEAASSGIIPLLRRVIQNKSPLKQFALPILCDLANAGKVSRRLLWQYDGMKLYLNLLEDQYWRVSALDAILNWMQDETARVEDVLLEKGPSESLVKCFVESSGVSFEGILDPFLKILRLSVSVTTSISTPTFFTRLAESLEKTTKAVIKLNLLRLTRVTCDAHPDSATVVARFKLVDIIDKLAKQDEAILVRELAKEIGPGLLFGSTKPKPSNNEERQEADDEISALGLGTGRREREKSGNVMVSRIISSSSMRRTTSEGVLVTLGKEKEKERERERIPLGLVTPGVGDVRHKRKISRSQLK